MNIRTRAAQALCPVLQQKASLTQPLAQAQQGLSAADAALVQEICFGVMRFLPRLQAMSRLLLKQAWKNKDTDLHALLLVGMYQLIYTRIPAHAALSETVEGARELNKTWATKVLNACLRRVQEEGANLVAQANQKQEAAYAHPSWLLKAWKKSFGTDWQAIAEANNQRPPFTVRVNTQAISRDDYLKTLADQGIQAEPAPYATTGVYFAQALKVENLPGFAQGWVSVQDEAAQLAADLLQVKAKMRVLDACCAPGGKSMHLLQAYPQLGELVALDKDPQRLQAVQTSLDRLQPQAPCQLICADAAQPDTWWDGQAFDRILLDAPCSGTGVIRRHPDIKHLRRLSDIDALVAIQQKLLQSLWPLLTPNGILVYATCSTLTRENKDVMANFIYQHPDAEVIKLDTFSWGQASGIGRQLLPQPQGHDGFFYACLKKVAS
ncbi:16S rRNA (cytosine967-C5)-methyltransferase [Allopseudospirillum japonicum]|uniref:16S rRNA (cytosine(967)-C(5))-methyltransferase n=1 Tax=Allopseudospirillum japonicum TaxID=64971 RepID=A0A1H6QUL6_9GAMM|nr:16S rRNA (cytosine(967)-C(5))-methyltransferase RsmB [Allopseudospirillum japonicum]SEI47488.1 16S rRNA (cytosine967-C5)-methyltransferase [Allopseudospirillum japonicum]